MHKLRSDRASTAFQQEVNFGVDGMPRNEGPRAKKYAGTTIAGECGHIRRGAPAVDEGGVL